MSQEKTTLGAKKDRRGAIGGRVLQRIVFSGPAPLEVVCEYLSAALLWTRAKEGLKKSRAGR